MCARKYLPYLDVVRTWTAQWTFNPKKPYSKFNSLTEAHRRRAQKWHWTLDLLLNRSKNLNLLDATSTIKFLRDFKGLN